MAKSLTWGTLSTTSTRSDGTNVSDAFGNPYSFADVGGVPYFYASDLDASMVDLFKGKDAAPRAAFALSEASVMLKNGTAAFAACQIGAGTFGDPENPPCARLVMSGVMSKVARGSAEEKAANAALFARHPAFKSFPKDHGFYTVKMDLDGLWLIAAYGGAAIIPPADYFAASASGAVPSGLLSSDEPAVTRTATAEATLALAKAKVAAVSAQDEAAGQSSRAQSSVKTARWMAKSLTWGVLSTTSTRSEGTNVSAPFGNPYSFADVNGVPYFYASAMDASMIDLFVAKGAATRATFALSEASLGGHKSLVWKEKCQIGTVIGDPEEPPCARLVMSGVMAKVTPGSKEAADAKAALFARHPSFAAYPKSHDFFFCKMNLEGLWLIDFFGGAKILSPAEYFSG